MLTKHQQHDKISLKGVEMIDQLLKQLDFSDKEIKIYLEILKLGKVSPADLSKATKINRTTVYSIAEELIRRGIVSKDLTSKNHSLIALPPRDLDQIIKKDEKNLEEKKQVVNQVIKELQKVSQQTKYSVPKIVFIEQDELEDYLYKQTNIWNESIHKHDHIWWGFQDYTLVECYRKWIEWTWTLESNVGLYAQLLTNKSGIEDYMHRGKRFPRRKIKFWKGNDRFTATTWVCGDYVIMVVTDQNPHYLVEIYDAVLAHNLRELFGGIWKTIR